MHLRSVTSLLVLLVFATQVYAESRVQNISTRATVQTGNQVTIVGFIIEGSVPKEILIRARGGSLATVDPNLSNLLVDPTLQLFRGSTLIDENDDWQDHTNAGIIPQELQPPLDPEAAIRTTLEPGAYTAIVRGVGESTGIGIVEVFELAQDQTRLVNISTRGFVGTGNEVLIGGFIISGDGEQRVTIRARGESLLDADPELDGLLADPTLELFNSDGERIDSNDDWRVHDSASDMRSDLAPTLNTESAITLALEPGAYTAIVRGSSNSEGIGIVEVFAVDEPPISPSPTSPDPVQQPDALETVDITRESSYTNLGTTASDGSINVTEVLVNNGYVASDNSQEYFITITDSAEVPLADVDVSYVLEGGSDVIHLLANDASSGYSRIYQTENLAELLEVANSDSRALLLPGARILIRILMRSLRAIEFADTTLSVIDLFSLDIRFRKYEEEIFLEGTVGDFYSAFSTSRSLLLPVAMKRFVRTNTDTSRASVSRAFEPDQSIRNEQQLVSYLQNVGGYFLASSETRIRVKVGNVDGRNRFYTMEVVEDDNNVVGDLYDVDIGVRGFPSVSFDALGNPDFAGWIIIRGTTFEFVLDRNSLSASTALRRIPIQIGERIRVSIIEEDPFFNDEILEFDFNFTGEGVSRSNDLAEVSLTFSRLDVPPVAIEPKSYTVLIRIEGSRDGNFDILNGAPDFQGTIQFSDVLRQLVVTDNSFTATYEFRDVLLVEGDLVSVFIEDDDPGFDDDVIEFDFRFDASDHIETNDRVVVTIQFTES